MSYYFRDGNNELQRFRGPCDDPPESASDTGGLSNGCETLLNEFDLFSAGHKHVTDYAEICDNDEGAKLFVVPVDIPPVLALDHSIRPPQLKYGEAAGKRGIQGGLRALLDVPANPPEPSSH